MLWGGRVLSALPVVGLLASGAAKLSRQPPVVTMFSEHLGFPAAALQPIGATEVVCAILYAIPKTSMLGAILLTAYLGGAVCAHVRVSEGFGAPILIALFMWAGLFLREPRLRALLPLRSNA